ncbi:hypothetical protein ACI2K6_12955 [Microbacterium sp. NPDC006705]|uniref:hypothetical protein n=1 Tax=Microbacterium sp. NPDC006705 TaxID=3364181 RepID=UPI00384B5A51
MSLRARMWTLVAGVFVVVLLGAIIVIGMSLFGDREGDAAGPIDPPDSEQFVTPLPTPTALPPEQSAAPTDPSAPSLAAVTVVLAAWQVTDAGAIEASAFVQALVEDDGTCVLHARSGETVREIAGTATPTGQNTSCGFLVLPADELAAGDWTIWFDYTSPTAAGTSEAVTLAYDKDAR